MSRQFWTMKYIATLPWYSEALAIILELGMCLTLSAHQVSTVSLHQHYSENVYILFTNIIHVYTWIWSVTDGTYDLGGASVYCQGYQSICAAGGNNDFRLNFTVNSCATTTTPTTTTPTTTTATTTMPVGCTCSAYVDTSSCSATCGPGTKTQQRTCTGCNPVPVLTQTVACNLGVSKHSKTWLKMLWGASPFKTI